MDLLFVPRPYPGPHSEFSLTYSRPMEHVLSWICPGFQTKIVVCRSLGLKQQGQMNFVRTDGIAADVEKAGTRIPVSTGQESRLDMFEGIGWIFEFMPLELSALPMVLFNPLSMMKFRHLYRIHLQRTFVVGVDEWYVTKDSESEAIEKKQFNHLLSK